MTERVNTSLSNIEHSSFFLVISPSQKLNSTMTRFRIVLIYFMVISMYTNEIASKKMMNSLHDIFK